MGWKTLKDAYGIDKHIVCVTSKGICIGSGYVHDLVTIDTVTGRLRENEAFLGFIRQYYPALVQATPAEILAHIQAEDTFAAAIPVFTYEGATIVEKRCETPGWPNTTHDGALMYENTYSTGREVVIGWAKRSAKLEAEHLEEGIARLNEQLADMQSRLSKARMCQVRLDSEHPAVPAAAY